MAEQLILIQLAERPAAALPAATLPASTLPASILPDAAERERALDISRSWIVEAPAGSGKTALLIQRFLKLLATVDDPAQVLAITFTRKAMREMRERVLAQLDAARSGDPDEASSLLAQAVLARDAQLGWNLLDHPHRLNIRTIDSVCADIAQTLPVLSGSGGSQSPIEDARALYAKAARQTLMLLGGADPALTAALELILLHRDGNLAECECLIASMLAVRDQWGELIPLPTGQLDDAFLDSVVLPKFEKLLDRAICRDLTRLTQLLPAPILESLCALAAEMAHAEGYKGAPSPIAICKARNQSPARKAEDLNHWRALIHLLITSGTSRHWRLSLGQNHVHFEILKHHQVELKAIIATLSTTPGLIEALCQISALPPAIYPPEQWLVTKALFRVLSRALIELQAVFSDQAQCDFTEPSLLARSALRRDESANDLGASSGTHLRHLLVDEMQDTSNSQYEIIRLLTQHWDAHQETVFLVGDPKQSVYLFRQARVERFVQTMHTGMLGDLSLGSLHLTANFRSQRNLVDAFNEDFSLLFSRAAHPSNTQPDAVPYRAVSAVRKPSAAAARVWQASPLPYSDVPAVCASSRRAQTELDAASICRIIQQWRARPLPAERSEPWKIAVLVRNRTHLLEIVQALRHASIPFRAVDIEPLDERQEILDLLALTRALLHPADRTAWLALLRTPWCGLTLTDLHLLTGKDDPAWAEHTPLALMADRGDLLSGDGMVRLQRFWQVMNAALEQRGRMPLARWVERTWHAFNAKTFATEEAILNVEAYFGLLKDLEAPGGTLDVAILNTRLKRLYAAPSLHPEAVDLMTIHGSKGLEWDVVLVPALERIGQKTHSRLLSWLEVSDSEEDLADGIARGIIAPIKSKGEASCKLNQWMQGIESAREASERKRLFYVACTRAREELHLFAAPRRKKDGSLSISSDSLLQSAWPAAKPHFLKSQTSLPTLFLMSARPTSEVIESLAASIPAPTPSRLIQRIPYPARTVTTSNPLPSSPSVQRAFERPQGSFEARAFGNAMHSFLQILADRLSGGASPSTLLAELPAWTPRSAAILRSNGLSATQVERLNANILAGLAKTLRSPEGQWILAPHQQAASESSLVSWTASSYEERSSIRLDRTFLAGAQPGSTGSAFLWIIDYKTATHGQEGLASFLEEEKQKYSPQLETYARKLTQRGHPIRLALFYPMLPKLIWWAQD